MNKVTVSLLALVATLALIRCSDSSAVLKSSGTSSAANESSCFIGLSSSSVNGSSSSSSVLASSSSSFNPFNANISYGTMTDSRDSQTYKTVVIGTQTWMAQNLNYYSITAPENSSWCYKDSTSYCDIYGRLYDYSEALTICPTGWHLPDTTEWNTLVAFTDDTATAGTALMSAAGWPSENVGTNSYGFSALPGSFSSNDGFVGSSFINIGIEGDWWVASGKPMGGDNAYEREMFTGDANVFNSRMSEIFGLSVRCLKD